jgi:hypothetical protein
MPFAGYHRQEPLLHFYQAAPAEERLCYQKRKDNSKRFGILERPHRNFIAAVAEGKCEGSCGAKRKFSPKSGHGKRFQPRFARFAEAYRCMKLL